MRWMVSGALWVMAGVLLYPFFQGAFIGDQEAIPSGDPWGSALGPLWMLTLEGGAVLFVGAALIVLGVTIHFWNKEFQETSGAFLGWNSVLQAAFSLNVLLAAVLLLALSLAMRDASAAETVGSLYLLGCGAVFVGSFLAFALLWQKRSRLLYGSTLVLHLVEISSVVAVFLMGFGE